MLFLPTGILELLSRKRIDYARFNPMDQPPWLARRRDQIIPAPRDVPKRMKSEHPVSQRIAHVVVEKQPAVKLLALQRFLYAEDVHAIRG